MIGRLIKGKYKIYDVVGSGGFATVYVGRNLDTNEMVAIKVLSQQLTADPRYVERFRREAMLAERLQHPNIVCILDHGIEDGIHFLVMEFVEGLTLAQVIERKGPLPVAEMLSYLEQTCAGLQAAFQMGIIHRDIKPANLMVTPGGTVKIMDFGIARVESMTGLTQSGAFLGTPRYLSPEIARGSQADIRSDLYSLGLIAHEMLTGVPPFDGENPWAVLRKQIESQPAPVSQYRADVAPWLEAAILRAVAKDPAERFQTPAEMLAAVQQRTPAPTPVPVAAAAAAPAPRRRKGVSRGLVLGLAGAATIAVLGLVAFLLFGLGGEKADPTVTSAVAQATEASPAAAPTFTPVIVVITNTPPDTIVAASTESAPTETSSPPTATLPPTDVPLPVPTDAPQPAPTDTPLPTPTDTPPPEPTDTPSPQPTDTPEPTPPPTQGPTSAPQPTNTSKPSDTPTSPPPPPVTGQIVYSAGGTLHIVDAATGQDKVGPIPNMRQPDFRRDGQQVIAKGFQSDKTSLWTIDAGTGAFLRQQSGFTDDFYPFWAPPGDRFAYSSFHHGLGNYQMLYTQKLDDRSPKPEVTVLYSGQQIRGTWPVWMDNDWLAFTGCDNWPNEQGVIGGSNCGIYRLPSWGGRPVGIVPGSTNMRATDEQSGQLVYMSQESGDWEVLLIPVQGGSARSLSQSPGSQDGLGTFSPDGKLVAFVSNRGGSWAIWAVKTDGTGLTKLFDLPAPPTGTWTEEHISWGP